MHVTSIDIGVVNVGFCCMSFPEKRIICADKLSLAPSLRALKTDAELIPRVYKLFFSDDSPYAKYIKTSRLVLVEIQMKARMKVIQNIIGTFCFANNIEFKFVSPRSIKAHFSIGSRTRAKQGKSVRGMKNNHSANKIMAIDKALELYPTFMSKLKVSKRDDVSDALLQARWYIDKVTEVKKKKKKK